MQQIIGLKELKQKPDVFAKRVKAGHTFIVVKQSKPMFKISQPMFEEADLEEDGKWETVLDFNKIRKGGVPFDQVIKASKALDEQDAKAVKKTSAKRTTRHHR